MVWLIDRLIAWAEFRGPNFVIGVRERPYLRRWWLLPRNPILNVYLHQFLRSDDDRALHDHPWLFNASWLLRGDYIEWVPSWECNCGGQLFRIARHCGPYCANCGADATGWFD